MSVSVQTYHRPLSPVDLFGNYDEMVRYIDEIDEKRSYDSQIYFSKKQLSQNIKNKMVITMKIEIMPRKKGIHGQFYFCPLSASGRTGQLCGLWIPVCDGKVAFQ